jgi:hypothetical protein
VVAPAGAGPTHSRLVNPFTPAYIHLYIHTHTPLSSLLRRQRPYRSGPGPSLSLSLSIPGSPVGDTEGAAVVSELSATACSRRIVRRAYALPACEPLHTGLYIYIYTHTHTHTPLSSLLRRERPYRSVPLSLSPSQLPLWATRTTAAVASELSATACSRPDSAAPAMRARERG